MGGLKPPNSKPTPSPTEGVSPDPDKLGDLHLAALKNNPQPTALCRHRFTLLTKTTVSGQKQFRTAR
jgi:hypothetical protein